MNEVGYNLNRPCVTFRPEEKRHILNNLSFPNTRLS